MWRGIAGETLLYSIVRLNSHAVIHAGIGPKDINIRKVEI